MRYDIDDVVRLPTSTEVLGHDGDARDIDWPGWHPRMEDHGGLEGVIMATNAMYISIVLLYPNGERSSASYSYTREWLDKVNSPELKLQLNGADNKLRKIEKKIVYLKNRFKVREELPKVRTKIDNVFNAQKKKLALQVAASQEVSPPTEAEDNLERRIFSSDIINVAVYGNSSTSSTNVTW